MPAESLCEYAGGRLSLLTVVLRSIIEVVENLVSARVYFPLRGFCAATGDLARNLGRDLPSLRKRVSVAEVWAMKHYVGGGGTTSTASKM